jgi:hypothetical protein
MFAEKLPDVCKFETRLFGGESSIESHRCHPEKCCSKRQLKKTVFLLSKGSLARNAVAAASSIGLAYVDVCWPALTGASGSSRPHKRARAESGNQVTQSADWISLMKIPFGAWLPTFQRHVLPV